MSFIPQDKKKQLDTLIINHKIHQDEINVLTILLNKQYEICSYVLQELKDHDQKISCWAWYIFPTWRDGRSDPLKTYITDDTAPILLELAPQGQHGWRSCLEKIIELTENNNNKLLKILPGIDIPRVYEFIIFWNSIPNKLKWLENVLIKLNKFFNDDDIKKYVNLDTIDNVKKQQQSRERERESKREQQRQKKTVTDPPVTVLPITAIISPTNKIKQLKILIDEHFTKINNLIK